MLATRTVFAFDGGAFLERMIAGRLGLAGEAHVRLVSLYQASRSAAPFALRLCRMRLRGLYVHSTPNLAGSLPARQYRIAAFNDIRLTAYLVARLSR
jgi:hypothetical protein